MLMKSIKSILQAVCQNGFIRNNLKKNKNILKKICELKAIKNIIR
jgi:hypothetical protein